MDIIALSCGPKASTISGISSSISPHDIGNNLCGIYERVLRAMAQVVLKIAQLPHIGRTGQILEMARAYGLHSPIMAPGHR